MAKELRAHKVKRLHMRSMRRGIKEMDLILSAFAADHLAGMDDSALTHYDDFLNENDHDLYQWVTGQIPVPDAYSGLVSDIRNRIADQPVGKV